MKIVVAAFLISFFFFLLEWLISTGFSSINIRFLLFLAVVLLDSPLMSMEPPLNKIKCRSLGQK